MNYPDSVHFLYALGNEIKTAKFGLERIQAVLAALGRPQDRCRFVHVAGTNGKGSVCAMVESGLRAHGVRTGLFTSPHLAEPTERIRLDGRPIAHSRFTDAFNRVHACAEQMLTAGTIDLHPTYFETVTAMAMLVFAEEQTGMVVLETGLGGRLDATNVVHPELCVITPVDFDHEAYLGRSLEAIAGEKAGILKAGVPAVFAGQRPEAAAVLDARAALLGVPVRRTSEFAVDGLALSARGSSFQVNGLRITCPLPGEHQVENALTAVRALQTLGVPPAAIETGIARTRWPGRLELLAERPETIVDGAHNPAGARALAAYIQRFYAGRRVRLIFGAMRDKAIAEMAGILFPVAQQVIVTAPRQARALSPEAMREIIDHPDLTVVRDLEQALTLVRESRPGDVVFISGSLFLVAEARELLAPEKGQDDGHRFSY
ncbi:MAG: bifunctional folylpolyglutamate synthase/dihydrofolate synthase [Candidatus Sulfopaludibacter sp.]|nr:bifunctional folylpolyglutamate synthase/dihydrofolate synthase [Candidatus Sulfopaludibacter sp.]